MAASHAARITATPLAQDSEDKNVRPADNLSGSLQRRRRRGQQWRQHIPRRRAGAGRDSGTITFEFAIAGTLFGLLLMTIAQFALWAHATHIAQAAANSGAQTARLYYPPTTTGAGADPVNQAESDTRAVLDQLSGTTLADRQVTVTRDATTATVTVEGTVASVVPGIHPRVHVTVTAPRETVAGQP